jgi:hypothetical protein
MTVMTAETIIMQVLDTALLGLTPVERWQAARKLNNSFMSNYGFVLITAMVLVVLIAVLMWVSYSRILQGRKVVEQSFINNAKRRGLSSHEQNILRQIISHSGLEHGDSIFTTQNAFERGVTKLMQAIAAKHTPKESEQLKAGLSFLREKLGFKPSPSPVLGSTKDASTRQIPVGKEIQIERRKAHGSESIEAVVAENDDMAVTVKLAMSLQTKPGDIWRAHYYFGSYVWEFDTSVVRCDGDILVLNHSEDVRSINRRRFSRVPASKPALIASFPFFKKVESGTASGRGRSKTRRRSASVLKSSWAVPEFVPAVVTELAGPGLRIESPLEAKAGDRLLIVFRLDEEGQKNSTSNKTSKAATSRIVGDLAQVRRCTALEKGFLIAVELVGLSDSDIDQLMQATKAVSSKAGAKEQETSAHTDSNGHTKQDIARPKVMQGA